MVDAPTPGDRPEDSEEDIFAVEPTTHFIVIHANASGHLFATRVIASDDDDAEMTVLSAHEDNTVEDILPDDGSERVKYGENTLVVQLLSEEP